MRRRMKKMRQQKGQNYGHMKIKKKYKYETRSRHAKNRQRAKDGKFLSLPENEQARTESTVLKEQEDEPEEEKVPCCAEEAQDDHPKEKMMEEKEDKVKLEMDHLDNISMNSEELLAGFVTGTRRASRRDLPDHSPFEDGPSLRRHDSLFDTKR